MDSLRVILSPVLTEECFDKFLIDYNFTDVPCLKYGLSKGLGIGIILGSLFVKVPQILKIFRGKSAAGITLIGVFLELFAMSSNLAYSYSSGFPFSAWGEVSFLSVQTSIIAALVLKYGYNSNLLPVGFFIAYGLGLYALISEITPLSVLWSMQAANVPVIAISRLLQAVSNYRASSTGQLSAITVFMLFFGSAARIFTSIQETGDSVVILTFATASFFNAIIAFQMIYYWNSSGTKGAKKGGVKKGTPKKNSGGKAKKIN